MNQGDEVELLLGQKARFDAAFELCRGRRVVRPKEAVDAYREVDLRIAFIRVLEKRDFEVDPGLTFEQAISARSVGIEGIEAVIGRLERDLGIRRSGDL